MRPSLRRLTAATAAALALTGGPFLVACAQGPAGDKPTIEPATPAASPPVTQAVAGTVRRLDSAIDFLAADAQTRTAAVIGADRSTLLLVDARDPAAPVRRIPLSVPAQGLASGHPGELLVPAGDTVFRVDVATGGTTPMPGGGRAVSATWLPDGRLAVGSADGKIRLIDPNSGSTTEIDGLVSVDGLAVAGDSLVALDRRQSSVTAVDVGKRSLGLALRAGNGATILAGDRFGRIVVTDTDGGALLAFTAEPLVLRQRYPVGSSPYAVAVDDRSGIVWLTSTATNQVVGYDLSSGIPQEIARFPTVRQPNTLAVDPVTGDLLVGSAVGDGLQTIAAITAQGGR